MDDPTSPLRQPTLPTPLASPRARQSSLRESNLALVARTVCGAREALSRADVAARTSLTRSTVSRLMDELVASGMIQELDPPATTGPGRPGTPLSAGSGIAAIGLQVDVTYLAARVVDLGGRVLAEGIEAGNVAGSEPAEVMARLGRLGETVLGALPTGIVLTGAGLAVPGLVSAESGQLLVAPNLGWADVHLASLVGSAATGGLPVRVGNEADLAALSAAYLAPGRAGPLTDFLYVSGEIGIGGAVVTGGRLMTGRHGWGGEIGHVCVDPAGPACACGSTGCLEQYAGRRALLAAAGLSRDASLQDLGDLARRGRPRPRQAVSAAARALGVALSSVINVLDLPVVVLGGHLGQLADLLGPELRMHLGARTLSARWIPPEIATARADTAPGATGAAVRELETVLSDPARWLG